MNMNTNPIHPDGRPTEILCILDRSGSMDAIREDAVGGFSAFLSDQKALPDAALMTLVLFNQEVHTVFAGKPIAEVRPLGPPDYIPAGMTALLDAVGTTIDAVGNRIKHTPEVERPAKVIVCILTDGLENASADYTVERIRRMIHRQQTRFGWEFVYLAANQDVFAEAGQLGLDASQAQAWSHSGQGVRDIHGEMSRRVAEHRRRQ